MALTGEQVAALAPDAAALAAGRKLAGGKDWSGLGRSAASLWGECKGSALYQVRVDLADLTAKCSCPSRKLPCKHALALLLIAVERPAAVPPGSEPAWVTEWLARRSETAARKEKARERKADAAPDPKARAKRAERRQDRVLEGLEGLDLWMGDLVRTGLAALDANGPATFGEQAARLVDAQAPGIAVRLRRMAALPGSGARWTDRLLPELGRLALLSRAYRRAGTLDVELQADLRGMIGYTLEKEEIVAHGDVVADEWAVLAQEVNDEDRVRVQRTWTRGGRSGRWALVLQFAAGTAGFPEALVPGTVVDAELAFWPGAFPQRALVKEHRGGARALRGRMPGTGSVADLLAATAEALGRQPWLDALPAALSGVRPSLLEDRTTWAVVDEKGAAVPLAPREPWRLLALSGGHPVDLAGEWDGHALRPLGAMVDGGFHPLGSGAGGGRA